MPPFTPAPDTPTPDAELLRRFVADRDEAAFELLVWRHSRLVFEVCRRVLRHRHDAEDATQAAFLVFARRADTVRTAVGGWLARVAYRCALRLANRQQDWNRRRQAAGCETQPADAGGSCDLNLDAELDRLPDRYRLPLVLCCLQGLSYHEAATQLKVKPGTLSGRLSRAKAMLRDRLLARGVAVPAALLLADLPRGSAASPEFVRSILTAAGRPGRAAAVAHGVTRMMTFQSAARRSLAGLAAAFAVLLGGSFAVTLLADEPRKPQSADPPKAKKTDKERLQGEWVFDSAEEVGGSNGIHQAWKAVVAFDGDKLTMTNFRGAEWKTTFTLDPTASPARFDMAVNDLAKKLLGFKDGTVKGIYRFDGEALEMCLADSPDDPRPAKFETGPKLKQFRFTLKKRAKDFDPAKLKEFKVKVIDADGKPVEGAVVCQKHFFSAESVEKTVEASVPPVPKTDVGGETTYDPDAARNDAFRPSGVLYVRHEKRKLVAIEPISPARIMDGLNIVLRPETKLTGKVVLPDKSGAGATNVYLSAHNVFWILAYHSFKSEFEFIVPAGEYRLTMNGDYLQFDSDEKGEQYYFSRPESVTVGPEGKELTLRAKPTVLGKLRGQPAPELGEMAAWKGDSVKLADLKGKVVMLYFFNVNDVGVEKRLTEMSGYHLGEYAKQGLTVVGVHRPTADQPLDTAKAFDAAVAALKGTDGVPQVAFPVGLMGKDGTAVKTFGLTDGLFDRVLIDRAGKVVGGFNELRSGDRELLEKLLKAK